MASSSGSTTLDVTSGTIWKQLLQLCIPVFFSSFFQQAYALVNTYVVSRFASEAALGGIQATTSLVDLVVGFSVGIGTGCGIICGQQFGTHQDERLATSVRTAMVIALVGGVVFSALGVTFAEPILVLMDTPADLMAEAVAFARTYFAAMVFSIVFNMGSAIQRSVGDTRTPSVIVAASCGVNIAFDLVLVAGLRLGAFGAGLSTAISLLFGAAATTWRLASVRESWRLDLSRLSIDPRICKVMILTGIPLGLQSSAYSISNIIIQSTVNSFGSETVIAWGLSNRIEGVVWMIEAALTVAVTTFAAQNFGAHDYDRMRRGLRTSFGLAVVIVGGVTAGLLVLAGPVVSVFSTNPEVLRLAILMMWFVEPFTVVFAIMDAIAGTIRGSGESLRPMIITMTGVCLLRVVWLLTWVPSHHTIEMVLLCYPVTYVITLVAYIVYYRHGHWLTHAETNKERALA